MFNWNLSQFTTFNADEIVECDELFMKHLIAVGPDEEDIPAHWIAGIVSRDTGRVYLQIVPDRDEPNIETFRKINILSVMHVLLQMDGRMVVG